MGGHALPPDGWGEADSGGHSSKKSVLKIGSQKTLNSRQTIIFTTEDNYLDYMQEQQINNRLKWTDDTNIELSKIDDICDCTQPRIAHW